MTGPDQAAGPPYTLVLSKTDALFARERKTRIRYQSDLEPCHCQQAANVH